MNILIVNGSPITHPGGVEQFCRDFVEMCRDRGWNVSVLTPHDLGAQSVALDAFGEALWAYRVGKAASRYLMDVDLVVSNGIWGSWIAKSVPRINVYHGTWAGNYREGQPRSLRKSVGREVRTWLERRSGRNAINVAVSETVKREVEEHYHLAVDCVIENGVDLRRFSPPTDHERLADRARLGFKPHDIVALYVGRMEWRKGIDQVNELARRLKESKEAFSIEFCVVTPEIERRFWSPHVRYIIGDNLDRVVQAYRAADVFVFPSRYEGCEFVTLQALATGLPVIGTSTGAMHMVRQRDDVLGAYISVAYSTDTFQRNVERYLGLTREEREDLSHRARRYAEQWASLELFRRRWTTLIQEVVDSGQL